MAEQVGTVAPELRASAAPSEQRPVVVVGVDGSLEAAEAAQYAALAADARGVDLLVVHAFPLPEDVQGPSGLRSVVAAAQRVTDDTLTQIRVPAGLRVRTEVEQTAPGALLLRLSRRAALITLGQHVFDPADQLVAGSVAQPLSSAAGCPVVVVPRGWSRVTRRGRTVAVALEGTSTAEAVLAFALAEAERQQSPVMALHVTPRGLSARAEAAQLRDLEEIVAAAKGSHPDLAVTVRLATGDAAEVILRVSRDVRLMVLGRSRAAGHGLHRRSVARAVLATACCPLVVVG